MPGSSGEVCRNETVISPEQLISGAALLAAVEAHHCCTARHSLRTVALADAVAQRLGLSEADRGEVTLVTMLHDVGKLDTPTRILTKPGPLTAAERTIVREHCSVGAAVVAQVDTLAHLAPAIRATHERWDGGGYPDGLVGDEIPLASRIAFVCDAYDAMTSRRSYRRAMSPSRARRELRRCAGTQFCPASARALLEALEPAPAVVAPSPAARPRFTKPRELASAGVPA